MQMVLKIEMAFKTENRKISNIFEGQKVYYVPRYQRNYVWKDKNWNELINDIKFTLGVENQKIEWSHFLGTIVLSKMENLNDISTEKYEIIDGQQRITTIFVLLIAIYSKLLEFDTDESKQMGDNIVNTYINIRTLSGENGLKFVNPEIEGDLKSILQKINDQEKISGNNGIIQKLFQFCTSSLDNYNFIELKDFLIKLLSINIVEIVSEEDEEIYNIFEVLNARGQKLKQMELLKNRVMKYTTPKDNDYIDKAKEKWREIENNLNHIADIDDALNHFVKCYIKKGSANKESNYSLIKEEIKVDKINTLLDDLLKFSESYKAVTNTDNTNIIYFNIKNNKQVRALFSALHLKLIVDLRQIEKYNLILRQLRNFFFLFNLTGKTSNKTDKLISNCSYKVYHATELTELEFCLADLFYKLNELIDSENIKKHIETNSSIKYSNKKNSSLNRNAKLVRYVLAEIYMYSQPDLVLNVDELTIEHLKSDDGTSETAQLNNLTLLTKESNEAIGNKPILEKIPLIEKKSSIRANMELKQFIIDGNFDLSERLNWIADQIENRAFKFEPDKLNITLEAVKEFQFNQQLCKENVELLSLLNKTGSIFRIKLEKDPNLRELQSEYNKLLPR